MDTVYENTANYVSCEYVRIKSIQLWIPPRRIGYLKYLVNLDFKKSTTLPNNPLAALL